MTFKRFPNGVDGKSFFEKRCPSHRPDWVPVAIGPGDRNGTVEYCRLEEPAALAWSANLAALELHAPDGPRRRPREPADVRVRPRPRTRRPASPSAPRWRWRSATCSPRRPRVAGQDVGVEGHAALRPAQLHGPGHTHDHTRPVRPGRRPVAREAAPDTRHHHHGEGRAARQDLRGLVAERPAQDDDLRLLAAGPGASDGVDAGHVGRGVRRGRRLDSAAVRGGRCVGPHRRARRPLRRRRRPGTAPPPSQGRPDPRAPGGAAYCWACWACSAWARAASAAASALACCLARRAMAVSTMVFNSAPFGHPA